MLISSTGKLMEALRQHSLLTPAQFADLPKFAHRRCDDARRLAKYLIQRDWLSVYQVNQLLTGNGQNLLIGPYRVLDILGQGGLSSVYKARHSESQAVVAIKMIKAEVFATPEGRQQFLREVEAMARLDHPNIVQFCDADQWNDTYYFAMEYVEGTDLGKVVRLTGALAVHEACDYIRQAALGLQHAYERNLIHRDIKPVNLFLTHVSAQSPLAPKLFATGNELTTGPAARTTIQAQPLIKILDWGLASLCNPKGLSEEQGGDAAKHIIGTADYLAPEQARNANTVDIRGDIYSLGCSLYYLLTAQAPHPDGTLMQKIMAHQTAEPPPIESFRDDVPAGLIATVQRMMAKKPEDRFQTPASAALSLLPFARSVPPEGSSATLRSLRGVLPPKGGDDTPIPPTLAGKGTSDRDHVDEESCAENN